LNSLPNNQPLHPNVEQPLLLEGLPALETWLAGTRYTSLHCLADSTTAAFCYPLIVPHLAEYAVSHHTITIPAGEAHKSLDTSAFVWEQLIAQGAGRSALLLCIGGGMVTDLGGFAAAIYKRGIAVAYLPTTLLAMADAAIGGKTGLDFAGLKNMLGTTTHPVAICTEQAFLNTLPQAEILSGWAEILKHRLLDGSLEAYGSQTNWPIPTLDSLGEHIGHATRFKLGITQKDPFENGERRLLNAGHTVGHALEAYMLGNGTPIPHGNAVAWGLVTELYVSAQTKPELTPLATSLHKYVAELYPALPNFSTVEMEAITTLALHDKKNRDTHIAYIARRLTMPGLTSWDYAATCTQVEIAEAMAKCLAGG
jgi:3-dehydroquinate synthase